MPYVYILECSDGSYYTGSTWDVEVRLQQHREGLWGANYTKKRLPVRLVYAEYTESVADAFAFEKRIQGWSHAKKRALIEGRWDELRRLARGSG